MADDITSFIFENGESVILALQRDFRSPSGLFGSADLGQNSAEEVVVKLPFRANIYDVRAHRWIEEADHVDLSIERVEPKIVALTRTKAAFSMSAPSHLRLAETGTLEFHLNRSSGTSVIHIEVTDPQGKRMIQYSRNVLVSGTETVTELLPFAINDPPGTWTIRAQDLLGDSATATIAVEP